MEGLKAGYVIFDNMKQSPKAPRINMYPKIRKIHQCQSRILNKNIFVVQYEVYWYLHESRSQQCVQTSFIAKLLHIKLIVILNGNTKVKKQFNQD